MLALSIERLPVLQPVIIDQSFNYCYGFCMARPRSFDELEVLSKARELFATKGYNGTSIDDLVRVTGLLRGSLYKAFGSKRNLFEMVLANAARSFEPNRENLDLLTVALKEMAANDRPISKLCRSIIGNESSKFSNLLGSNLLQNIKEK